MLDLLIAVNLAFILFLLADLWVAGHDPYQNPHMPESERTELMAQEHELIGQESPALGQVAAEYQGWGAVPGSNDQRSDHPQPTITEIAGPDLDFSFRDRRANLQLLGERNGTFAGDQAPFAMADHNEGSMAGHQEVPWASIGSSGAPPQGGRP